MSTETAKKPRSKRLDGPWRQGYYLDLAAELRKGSATGVRVKEAVAYLKQERMTEKMRRSFPYSKQLCDLFMVFDAMRRHFQLIVWRGRLKTTDLDLLLEWLNNSQTTWCKMRERGY